MVLRPALRDCARTQSLSAMPLIPAHSRGLLPIMLLRAPALVSVDAALLDGVMADERLVDGVVMPVELLVDGDVDCAPTVTAVPSDSAATSAFNCQLRMCAPCTLDRSMEGAPSKHRGRAAARDNAASAVPTRGRRARALRNACAAHGRVGRVR
ncbi:MAG TPA: hypothetical protein VLR71_17025 [Casimicrobiaceae bacterium]|nr:hypothetical protein [Casimicrobiaceae bacterium]